VFVKPQYFKGCERGPVAVLGNGPSLNNWNLERLNCDTVGINLSSDVIESEYWVTVAKDRADDVEAGKITAKKAVITQRVDHISESSLQVVLPVYMPLPDNYGVYSGQINIFRPDLDKPMVKTFGGMLAVQAAIYLGYSPIYLIGIDGGTHHFYPHRRDNIAPSYHKACFWHVYDWWRNQTDVQIYQTNPDAVINWFPVYSPGEG
jgi:hypothetical protein